MQLLDFRAHNWPRWPFNSRFGTGILHVQPNRTADCGRSCSRNSAPDSSASALANAGQPYRGGTHAIPPESETCQGSLRSAQRRWEPDRPYNGATDAWEWSHGRPSIGHLRRYLDMIYQSGPSMPKLTLRTRVTSILVGSSVCARSENAARVVGMALRSDEKRRPKSWVLTSEPSPVCERAFALENLLLLFW